MGNKMPQVNPYSQSLSVVQKYDKLEDYYNNNLYTDISDYAYRNGLYAEKIWGLRNPCYSSVEFFASKLMSSPIQLIGNKNPDVISSIQQLWKWSNFEQLKNTYIRLLAMLGDSFIKVNAQTDKVFFENIKPHYVTDFSVDDRGYIQTIKIEIPKVDENDQPYYWVEYWSKPENYYAVWKSDSGGNTEMPPSGELIYYELLSQLGLTFVPFVHIKFIDVGELRGHNSFEHCLLQIDDMNRQMTKIEQLLHKHNRALLYIETSNEDAKGNYLAARLQAAKDIELKEESYLTLQPGQTMKNLDADIKYDSALKVYESAENEVSKRLPEVKYYDLPENISGEALKMFMSAATDRATLAQSNWLAGIVRANQIGLTIGKNLGLFPITIGNYDDGSFEHVIVPAEMFPLSKKDIYMAINNASQAGIPLTVSMPDFGFNQTQIDLAVADALRKENQFNINFNQGIA